MTPSPSYKVGKVGRRWVLCKVKSRQNLVVTVGGKSRDTAVVRVGVQCGMAVYGFLCYVFLDFC